jgi:hypothetical protein
MFPGGWPGLALLLLRISVAAALVVSAANGYLSSYHLLVAGVTLISISLSIGFLTPYLSATACAFAVVNLLIGHHAGSLNGIFQIFDAAALALLGPGAYSVDARLFGRRVTVVQPAADEDED